MLHNLIVSDGRAQELEESSRDWPYWDLTERQICDLELLLNGAFSPLSPLAGFVASEVTKNGGIALCAPIAPYGATRREVRALVESGGGFILVHVATPLDVCEQRDRKGLYAKARAGIIEGFTGISDPYEEPTDAEVVIDTREVSPEEAVHRLVLHLENEGYIGNA